MEGEDQIPSPNPSSPNRSTIFKDISNFKTPKPSNPNKLHSPFPQFFTASKQTPTTTSSTLRRGRRYRPSSIAPSSSRSKAARRRLKAFELELSQSSRKAEIQKQKSLKSVAKSLLAWLNFLFQNPRACGVHVGKLSGVDRGEDEGREFTVLSSNGKRDSWPGGLGGGVGIDGPWRSPKRQRDCTWRPEGVFDGERPFALGSSAFSSLRVSLQEICSFDDLTLRMRGYLSSESCKEILSVMTQVCKNIDEGRLKMKAHCPIVTDRGMKQKALQVLLSYNPVWLRIGLYIVFGGDSLLPTGDVNSDGELAFLKLIVDKLLLSHVGLAKAYAYNKLVEGLYRPGYFEALGNIILKRFLLLVLILDRAKSQSSLPIKYGIDGTDGGSPLLFGRQSNIKSSRQIIHDFLSTEIMHGEGNLLAHLVIVGYKVSYQQYPILEYEFNMTNLFEDLQDGVRLCRAIQLLLCDNSILTKMVVPSDTHKKNLVNCGVAMQYLKQAGMPLSDEDGTMIIAEDIASGEKELTLSMLWNMFVHLQVPLLINKAVLLEEICKVKGADLDYSELNSLSHLEMLLKWTQAISQKYDTEIHDFASLVDGKAMWCLIDFYFRNDLRCSCYKKTAQDINGKDPYLFEANCSGAVHNFILSQKLTTTLENFPEVLQVSDILESNGACNERSVIVLLVFLPSQLIGRKNTDQLSIQKFLGCNCQSPEIKRFSLYKCFLNPESPVNSDGLDEDSSEDAIKNFRVIQAWWRDMANHLHNCGSTQTTQVHGFKACIHDTQTQRERAVKTIQTHFRGLIERRHFMKLKATTVFLQTVIRAWQIVKTTKAANKFTVTDIYQLALDSHRNSDVSGRYLAFLIQRHKFVMLKKSVLLIQQAARAWITRRRRKENKSYLEVPSHHDLRAAAIIIQSYVRRWRERCRYIFMVSQLRENISKDEKVKNIQEKAALVIQLAWKRCLFLRSVSRKSIAAANIQNHWRGWMMRRSFLDQKKATIKIQSVLRSLKYLKDFDLATRSAIIIQSHVRRFISGKRADRQRYLILFIQRRWRGWLARRNFLYQRKAAIEIQSGLRCLRCCMVFKSYRCAAIEIQRFARGQITRHRLLGASIYRSAFVSGYKGSISRICIMNFELKIVFYSIRKLQRWWKRVLLCRFETRSAIVLQSHVRGWIARREVSRRKHRIVVVQSYWKGYLARKELKGQLLNLRLRVLKSAANVDEGMRLINRLVSALSELLSIRSVSSVLHTCATLDMTTQHSQKCCETLVAAGAVDTLLKLIRSVSRSIPDQEVLRHALSTLRNLSHYQHLADVLIDADEATEIILWELLRNKDEGFFIASEILKNLCSIKKGVETIRNLTSYLKRLQSLVDDLKKKVMDKRKKRLLPVKDDNERRLREAMGLLKLITSG